MAQDFSNATFHPQWQQLLAPPQAAQQAPPQQQKGKGGFLSSIISELGGGGGAAGGAALGTLLLPGIGTVIGGGLGGLLGGFGGKAIEQKVRDNQNVFGAGGSFKKDLGEGAVDGALSAAGEGFQALKGAKAAKNAGAGLGDLVAQGGGDVLKTAPKTGVIQDIGQSLKAGAGGYGIGAKVAGEAPLTAQASADVGSTLEKLGIKASSPEAQAKSIGQKIQNIGNLLTNQYEKGAVNIGTAEANDVGAKILDQIAKTPGLTESAKNYALEETSNLVKNHAASTSDLWKYTKSLESNGINFAANPDSTTAGQQVVNKIISGNVRDVLNTKVPGVADANSLFHDASNAQKYILSAAKDTKGGGITGRVLNLSPVKSLESKAGGALSTVGKFAAGTGGPVTQLTNNLIRQSPAGLARALGGANTQPDQSTDVSPQIPDPSQNVDPSIGAPMQAQQPTYSLQNALMDAQRDPKNASQYLAFANAFSAQAKNSASDTKLTAAQSTLKDGITSALAALDSTEQLLSTAGGAKGATGATANIPILGQYLNPSGHSYEATKTDTALQLAKALSGTSRAPASVFQQVLHSLPSVTDTPQVAANKIANLRAQVQAQAHAHGFDDILGDNSSGSQAQLAQILAGLGQ